MVDPTVILFPRASNRRKDGKDHRNSSAAESRRVRGGASSNVVVAVTLTGEQTSQALQFSGPNHNRHTIAELEKLIGRNLDIWR